MPWLWHLLPKTWPTDWVPTCAHLPLLSGAHPASHVLHRPVETETVEDCGRQTTPGMRAKQLLDQAGGQC